MAMLVIAETPEAFDAWREAQFRSAVEPADDEQRHGHQVFLSKTCVICHTIQGTLAGGKVAPDLTHVASRRYLAAGTLPTSRGSLAAWIADPQRVKPGNNMPRIPLTPDELNALAAYLSALR